MTKKIIKSFSRNQVVAAENVTYSNDENQKMVGTPYSTSAIRMPAYLEVADTIPKRYIKKNKGKKSKVLRDTKLSRGKVHHEFDELEIIRTWRFISTLTLDF